MSNADNSDKKRPRTAVVACSGNNSNGELGDQIARRLHEEGLAEMMSVAQVNVRIASSSRLAMSPKVLVINGCHSGCASECLNSLGFSDFDVWDVKEHRNQNGNPFTDADLDAAVESVKAFMKTRKPKSRD